MGSLASERGGAKNIPKCRRPCMPIANRVLGSEEVERRGWASFRDVCNYVRRDRGQNENICIFIA